MKGLVFTNCFLWLIAQYIPSALYSIMLSPQGLVSDVTLGNSGVVSQY